MLWLKAHAEIVGLAAALTLLSAAAGWFYLRGRVDVEKDVAIEEGHRIERAGRANRDVWESVTAHTDNHVAIATELLGERANGRREIANHTAAPAPQTVGPRAVVDPVFGQRMLCRLERVRLDQPSAACAAAAAAE